MTHAAALLCSPHSPPHAFPWPGLRRITHAYTRIPIPDICNKLQLDNPEDAEYIVAKAIRCDSSSLSPPPSPSSEAPSSDENPLLSWDEFTCQLAL